MAQGDGDARIAGKDKGENKMKKRLAMLALGAILGSILAAASPAYADCNDAGQPCLPKSAAGAFVFADGVAVGGAGGEDAGWCVGGTCHSHEWNMEGILTATCSAGGVAISDGSVTLNFATSIGGVVIGAVTGVPGFTSALAAGAVEGTTCSGTAAFAAV